MPWFDPLTALIVGVPSAVVGAVVGWLLSRGSHARDIARSRLETTRDTAILLRTELAELKSRFRRQVPTSILRAPGADRFEAFPTAAYDELRSAGRLIQLGPKTADMVHHAYRCVTQTNELLAEINAGIDPVMRDAEYEATFEDLWSRVLDWRKEFYREFRPLDGALASFEVV